MLPPALQISLWIGSRRRNVKALIMEGETFEDPDVGYRPCSYLRSNFSD